jgi:hypothetical protein
MTFWNKSSGSSPGLSRPAPELMQPQPKGLIADSPNRRAPPCSLLQAQFHFGQELPLPIAAQVEVLEQDSRAGRDLAIGPAQAQIDKDLNRLFEVDHSLAEPNRDGLAYARRLAVSQWARLGASTFIEKYL